eukprot:Em0008g1156a
MGLSCPTYQHSQIAQHPTCVRWVGGRDKTRGFGDSIVGRDFHFGHGRFSLDYYHRELLKMATAGSTNNGRAQQQSGGASLLPVQEQHMQQPVMQCPASRVPPNPMMPGAAMYPFQEELMRPYMPNVGQLPPSRILNPMMQGAAMYPFQAGLMRPYMPNMATHMIQSPTPFMSPFHSHSPAFNPQCPAINSHPPPTPTINPQPPPAFAVNHQPPPTPAVIPQPPLAPAVNPQPPPAPAANPQPPPAPAVNPQPPPTLAVNPQLPLPKKKRKRNVAIDSKTKACVQVDTTQLRVPATPTGLGNTSVPLNRSLLQAVEDKMVGANQKRSCEANLEQLSELDKETVVKETRSIIEELCEDKDMKGSRRRKKNKPKNIPPNPHSAPANTKLKKAEQPQQRQAVLQLELTEEQKETQEVFCKFQSILNKLTHQNVIELVEMTRQLKINTEERLRGVVDLIFTRATTETVYSEVYANFCRVLAPLAVSTVNPKGRTITFKRLLVTKCQQEFEKDMQEDEERKTMQKGVETAETEEIRKKQQMELEAAEMASRHPSLGNIRFFGELYKLMGCRRGSASLKQVFFHKLKMLSESTIHQCVIRLLASLSDEMLLESFAKLVTVAGKELDEEESKGWMDTYISRMNDIIKSGAVSEQLQFVLQDMVELRNNKWVPRRQQKAKVKTKEQKETQEVFHKFQSILNKLTPQKFTELAEVTCQLKINTMERLRGVVELIFTRAITETTFIEVYANLCRVMAPLAVETVHAEGKPQTITFKRLLLSRCQQEFEKDMQEDEERKTMQKGVETAETEEIRKQRQMELEAAEMASRHQSLGNIRFIGELYKLKILSESIIHDCMRKSLASTSDEKSLERFAKLMTVTGKELDKEEAKLEMDTYFSIVNDIIKNKTVSKRVQFLLQDVVDLRDNQWVPRQWQDTKVKTIDQIHREAEYEEQMTKQLSSQYIEGDGGDGRKGSIRGERNRPRKIIPQKPRSAPEAVKAVQPWQRQGLIKEQKETQDIFYKFQSILNKLTLQKLTELAEAARQLKINTEERLRGVVDMIFTRATTETVYSEVYANLCCVLAPLSVSTVNAKGKPETITFRRLLLSRCQQEFEKDKQEDEERKTMQKGVETAETEEIRKQRQMELEAAEMASRYRSLGNIRFYGELYKLKAIEILTDCTIHDCMIKSLASSDEKSLECFAKLMTVTGEELDKEEAKQKMDTYFSTVNDIIKKGTISKRVQFALQDVVDLRDNKWVPWQRQGTKVKTIDQIHREAEDEEQMTKQLASQYIGGDGGGRKKQLGLLHATKVATLHSPHSVSLEDLTARLGFANVSNNEILNWIERSCTPEECRSPTFITTLTTAMVQGAVTGKGSSAHLARDLFETRLEILTKYVNSDEKLELEVLLALEMAVAKLDHPPKVLCQMFNAVYDCEVVGENSCYTWRDRAQEGVEGKGTAVMSVKAFFDWLESAERESDSESISEEKHA